jgi:hypothetical protein
MEDELTAKCRPALQVVCLWGTYLQSRKDKRREEKSFAELNITIKQQKPLFF